MTAQQTQTKLEWRLTTEAPSFDLETDLWVSTADDGSPIYAPSSDECATLRDDYNHILATTREVRGRAGARMWSAQVRHEPGERFEYFGRTQAEAITNAYYRLGQASETAYCDAVNARLREVWEAMR